MSTGSPGWYLRRLRRMSAGEVVHRAGDVARRRAWARYQVEPGAAVVLPPGVRPDRGFGTVLPATARDRVPALAAQALVAAADRVLAGTWCVLGVRRPDSADPDWFADPLTGRRAPDRRLAFRIDHRDESVTGNVKQVWELSRHHHLTVLAAAWWLTADERYARTVDAQLRSWWRANPFLTGVHWTSGIEAGIRLLSWVWVRRLMDGWPKVGDLFENCDAAVRQIAWHQRFLAGFPSRGSSANNHAVAEAAGWLAAACAFDWYPESAGWRRRAAEVLERRLAANTFGSGLNRELATDYHRFVLELGLLAALEAEASDRPLSDGTWHRLTRMVDAGVAVLDVAGGPPRQGDGDEGRALVVDDPERDPWSTALGAGGAVLRAASWWPPLDGGVQAGLLAAMSDTFPAGWHERQRRRERPAERPRRFADAGLVLLRSRPGDGPEIWCRCDGGPHGFLSIAAHAHADALSVELRHDGTPILVDPGTYCYHGEPAWRSYFRSTAAHNTLQVAGVDQAVSGGPFLWVTHPVTTTLNCTVGELPTQTWTARHDGYRRLWAPAAHTRSVTLDSPARTLTVVDVVQTVGPMPVQLGWHLGPDVTVRLDGCQAALEWPGRAGVREQGELLLPPVLSWTAHRGEQDPVLGWYSPGFGRREPTTSLIGRADPDPGPADGAVRLVTTLSLR